jgi:hypothetical protein
MKFSIAPTTRSLCRFALACLVAAAGLTHSVGTITAPALITANVSPRRMQNFAVNAGADYVWVNRDASNAPVQTGANTADVLGVITGKGSDQTARK